LLEETAGYVQIYPQSDATADELRLHDDRGRGDGNPARQPGPGVVRSRLLRHRQSQREGGLPTLPRLVRLEPGELVSPPAGGSREEVRRVHGRCLAGDREGDGRVSAG